ncbi:hypothetical protein BHM03_00008893 [Ensete ventricosum]|nr:hypothetical protein BHM03_00008893 [Ensete ventricosum]
MRVLDPWLPYLMKMNDMTQDPPCQELVAKDLHQNEWRFRHIFRGLYIIFQIVQWDEPSSTLRPDSVSPWELEPLIAAAPSSTQPVQRIKRARLPASPVGTPGPSPSPGMDLVIYNCFHFNFCCHHTDVVVHVGSWKSQVETTQMFSFSTPQRGEEPYSSYKPACIFSSASQSGSIGFNASDAPPTAINSRLCWPIMTETQSDTFSASINREPCDRKLETSKGCRLFGIQLIESSGMGEMSPVPTISGVGVDQPAISLEVDSDRQSRPSNIERSDAPANNCEPEKLCLRSSLETQSRQPRSCTKVTD